MDTLFPLKGGEAGISGRHQPGQQKQSHDVEMSPIASSENLDSAWSAASCIPGSPEGSTDKVSFLEINLIGTGSMECMGSLLAGCEAQECSSHLDLVLCGHAKLLNS